MQNTPSKSRDFWSELSWLKDHNILDKVKEILGGGGGATRDKSALNRVQFKLKKSRNSLRDGVLIMLGRSDKGKKRSMSSF
jgi:hypothetical protein